VLESNGDRREIKDLDCKVTKSHGDLNHKRILGEEDEESTEPLPGDAHGATHEKLEVRQEIFDVPGSPLGTWRKWRLIHPGNSDRGGKERSGARGEVLEKLELNLRELGAGKEEKRESQRHFQIRKVAGRFFAFFPSKNRCFSTSFD